MVDWKKRINKSSSVSLSADEEIITALPLQPAGNMAMQLGLSGIGGFVGFLMGSKAKSKRQAQTVDQLTGKAAKFPQKNIVLAVSNKRLLAIKQNNMSGKPEDLLQSYNLSEVEAVTMGKKRVSNSMLITFDDKSIIDLDAVKGLKVESFISAFEALKK